MGQLIARHTRRRLWLGVWLWICLRLRRREAEQGGGEDEEDGRPTRRKRTPIVSIKRFNLKDVQYRAHFLFFRMRFFFRTRHFSDLNVGQQVFPLLADFLCLPKGQKVKETLPLLSLPPLFDLFLHMLTCKKKDHPQENMNVPLPGSEKCGTKLSP